jgi:hypothetical protein
MRTVPNPVVSREILARIASTFCAFPAALESLWKISTRFGENYRDKKNAENTK